MIEVKKDSKKITSFKSDVEFIEIRKFLELDENLFSKVEVNGVKFSTKFILNYLDPSIRLFFTKVKPVKTSEIKPVANLCIVHGFAHHSWEFLEFAYKLAQKGINCFMLDMRGHGLSGGVRFDWTIENMHQDIITLIKQAEQDNSNLPTFIFGHSMGGGLVSSLFINNQYIQIHGVILSSPLLGLPLTIQLDVVKKFIIDRAGNDLRDIVCNCGINPSVLTKDDREVVRLIRDHKNKPLAGMRTIRSMLKMCQRILENCKYFNLPVFIIHGDADKVCNLQDSRTFFEDIKSNNKELLVIKNGFHELLNDTERDEVTSKVFTWIMKNKNVGKTDRPFPIDLLVGPPKQVFNKIKLQSIFKLLLFILYIVIAFKLKGQKSLLSRLFWPISLALDFIRKNTF